MSTNEDTENNETTETTTPTTETTPPVEPKTETTEEVKTGEKAEEASSEFVPLTAEDITFPEGVEVQEGARDEFLDILNNREISPAEQAQKLVDLQTRLAREASETSSAGWDQMQTQWQDEVRADPEIGGAKLDGVLTNVAKIVDQYGGAELRQVMDLTGAGNNIHVIRFLNNIAKDLNEGGAVTGTPPRSSGDAASRLYPSMKE